ncbi:BnaCnng06720D [Brassica napus]|uniref:BnaCnng06720D protein n=1 Tax=Brassica napus TaxID=3708 RepID=A0A078H5S9_BRANA|nr:BnaCnng06720D [Brassica napus]
MFLFTSSRTIARRSHTIIKRSYTNLSLGLDYMG